VVGTPPISSRENAVRYPTDRRPGRYCKERVARSGIERCVVPSGGVIDSSSLASGMRQSSCATLSTTNMTNLRSVAAAVDDIATELDSCSLKHRRAGPSVKTRGCTERNHARLRVNGGEAGDGREKSLEYLGLYVDTSRYAVVHCLYDSRDCREGDGAHGDEALEGAKGNGDNFAFFVAQPMKTGRRRCSICGDIVMVRLCQW
jgi:hypothetical protein